MTHLEGERAQSFGEIAPLYDRFRPDYPDALVRDLLAGTSSAAVLDVGCGTGKAARAFLSAGAAVLGIELDERMATVARTSGVEVIVSSFEAFEPQARRFDLVISGQAWHWLDPALAPAKVADLLAPGGRLAPFWNRRRHSVADRGAEALERVVERCAPHLALRNERSRPGQEATDIAGHGRAIEASCRFGPVEVRRYPWS